MNQSEAMVLKGFLCNDDFARRILPFVEAVYFEDRPDRVLFSEIKRYIEEYATLPTVEALQVNVSHVRSVANEDGTTTPVTDEDVQEITRNIEVLRNDISDNQHTDWLIAHTEEWCKERALHNAVRQAIAIIDEQKTPPKNNQKTRRTTGEIPAILQAALAVSFDSHIGHDYLDDSDARYEYYHAAADKLPFSLDYCNRITQGGLNRKTLNIVIAGTAVGKSLFMCHETSHWLSMGKNVLYISGEMSSEKIAERIDANLFDLDIGEIPNLSKEMFQRRVDTIRKATKGRLIIHEYPTCTAHMGHVRHLLHELWLKKNFKPDVIVIDYLNLFLSARIRMGANVNSYTYIKAVSEEMRGLAVEFNVPILTATQTNRGGYSDSDFDLDDTSESFGVPMTADLMIGLISTEELEAIGQLMVKQLKNRYADVNHYRKFTIGVERSKMRLFDVEQRSGTGATPSNGKGGGSGGEKKRTSLATDEAGDTDEDIEKRQRGGGLNAHDDAAWQERRALWAREGINSKQRADTSKLKVE